MNSGGRLTSNDQVGQKRGRQWTAPFCHHVTCRRTFVAPVRHCAFNSQHLSRAHDASGGSIFQYSLDCPEETARHRLAGWLDGTELRWPGAFALRVAVSATCPFGDDSRPAFRQADVEIQGGGTAEAPTRVTWLSSAAVAVISAALPEAEIWLSRDAIEALPSGERSFLLVVLVFVLRRLGWFHVHGASLVDPRGRGWLFAGDSHCGKSTTTALMATQGWQVCTDDIGFVARAQGHVELRGTRARIALRSGGHALVGAHGGLPLPDRDKRGYWPADFGSTWIPVVRPDIVVFPRLGERTAVQTARPRDALSQLIRWSHWVLYEPVHAQQHLDLLSALAAQSRCFELTLGPDLFDNPALLEALVP